MENQLKIKVAASEMANVLRQITEAKKARTVAVVLSNTEEVSRLNGVLTELIDEIAPKAVANYERLNTCPEKQ